jgi:carbon monoxide dehydrogenase subunit G
VPVVQAWAVLLDLELVAPCMPGATLTSFDGTAFTGTVKVKLGPISLTYRGQGRITERDETGRRIAFVATGQDIRGGGGASARVTAVLHSADGGAATLVKVVTDLDISGKVAQFGRGMIADVSNKVIKQFADNLAATIAAGAAPAAASGAVPAASPSTPVAASAPAAAGEPGPAPERPYPHPKRRRPLRRLPLSRLSRSPLPPSRWWLSRWWLSRWWLHRLPSSPRRRPSPPLRCPSR